LAAEALGHLLHFVVFIRTQALIQIESMFCRILPWPSIMGHGRQHGTQKPDLFTIAGTIERCAIPREPKQIHAPFRSRLTLREVDLDDERFDISLNANGSMSTITSCTLDFNIDNPPYDNRLELRRSWRNRGKRYYQWLRWEGFTAYRRLFGVVFIVNLIMVAMVCKRQVSDSPPIDTRRHQNQALADILSAVSANLTAAIAIRNEHVINLLFRTTVIFTSPRLPLSLRCKLAKIYSFGGVHSACGVAATCWYILFVGISIFDYIKYGAPSGSKATLILSFVVWLLLITLLAGAHPNIRTHMHDYFELSHRFCGWAVLAVFWVQMFVLCVGDARQNRLPMAEVLVQTPTFWMLVTITGFVVYPWIRLRHVPVEIEKLSHHAVRVHFKGGQMPACRTIRISHSPLVETHSFATIPEPDGKSGYSMVVSRAGDWTSMIINNPPTKLWVKGVPAWGVLRISTMFNPVVIVATGSGIGPCLGLFNGFPNLPCRVLWSAKMPEQTYGKDIVNIVRRADKNAVIIDTNKTAVRPNMVNEARKLYKESNADAIVIISNPTLTNEVVHRLECEGIPAFGPIWDS
jgi:hypothetical protein